MAVNILYSRTIGNRLELVTDIAPSSSTGVNAPQNSIARVSGSTLLYVKNSALGGTATDWRKILEGPASATDNSIVVFDGTSGGLIKDTQLVLYNGTDDSALEIISNINSVSLNRPCQYHGSSLATVGAITVSGQVAVECADIDVVCQFRMAVPFRIHDFDQTTQAGGFAGNGSINGRIWTVSAQSGNHYVLFTVVSNDPMKGGSIDYNFEYTYRIF